MGEGAMMTEVMARSRGAIIIAQNKKGCVKGESNPQLNLGRVPCYHYTIDAR